MDSKSVDNVAATPASMDGMEMSSSGKKKQIKTKMQSDDINSSPIKDTLSQKVVYICSMDKEVISDKPGKCPICGMKLIPGH